MVSTLLGVTGHDGFWLSQLRSASGKSHIWNNSKRSRFWLEVGGPMQHRIFIPSIDDAGVFGFCRPGPDRQPPDVFGLITLFGMNMTFRTIVAFALLALTSAASESPRLIAIDPTDFSPPARNQVIECNEDIEAILSGKTPVHAVFQSMLMDGGTRRYQGHGYSITVFKSWCRIGGVAGFLVGPMVLFEKPLADEDELSVSFVRFVPGPEMRKGAPNPEGRVPR